MELLKPFAVSLIASSGMVAINIASMLGQELSYWWLSTMIIGLPYVVYSLVKEG